MLASTIRGGWLVGAVLAVGCTASPAATESASPTPEPPAVSVTECPDIELTSPSGERIDLTGTWYGYSSWRYYVYQSGECLWWAGGFVSENTPDRYVYVGPLATETEVFSGRLSSDFSFTGGWSIVRANNRPGITEATLRRWGTLVGELKFNSETGDPELEVRYTERAGSGRGTGPSTMVQISPDSVVYPGS